LPIIKSAIKRVRVSEKQRAHNKSIRTMCKTNITKAEKLIFSGNIEEADAAVTVAVSSLDRAAAKGVLHANNAARRKARLLKKMKLAKIRKLDN